MTYLLAAALVWPWASPAAAQDLDHFLPTFVVSAGECDGLPASFALGTRAQRCWLVMAPSKFSISTSGPATADAPAAVD